MNKTPHLDGHHAVFGRVIQGYDVVEKISQVPKGAYDRPKQDVVIQSLHFEGEFTPVEIGKL